MSEKSVYKVRKEKQAPFAIIEDDYRTVKKNGKLKISELTLEYLKQIEPLKALDTGFTV